MGAVMKDPNRRSQGRLHRTIVCMALLIMAVTCVACDKYEPTKPIEGVYRPTQCVTLQGIVPGGWLSMHQTIHPTVCQPMRVSELGVYTYGMGWSRPGAQVEVGKLEFSDAGVLVDSSHLRGSGTFDYKDRATTAGEWAGNNPLTTFMLVLVGLAVAVTIPLGWRAIESKRRRERESLEAEVARKAAARAAVAAARAAALAQLQRLISDAERAAASLPIILGETELTLDRADDELQNQLAISFWEAMEEAVAKLQDFQGAMSMIEVRRAEYSAQASTLDGATPRFRLGMSVLPDPTGTQSRLTYLFRQAQAIPHFCLVYEQRRTTSTLVAGFRSLGQAVERLGHRLVDEIGSLATSLDSRLDSLEKSLESSAAAAAEQSAALLTQLEGAVGSNDSLSRQLRQDAEAHSETERRALRMLDNIQHQRKPSIFDPP
jgi:hypothetical protein